jgi:hypothetical protein
VTVVLGPPVFSSATNVNCTVASTTTGGSCTYQGVNFLDPSPTVALTAPADGIVASWTLTAGESFTPPAPSAPPGR